MYFPPLMPSDDAFLNIHKVLLCLLLSSFPAFFLLCRGITIATDLYKHITAFVEENQPNITRITNYAALGDSYAAGIAAGRVLQHTCLQFSDSYPMQLIRTGLLGNDHTFQFLACSGAVMGIPGSSFSKKKLIDRQIKALKPTDLVTLSIGGNDVGFFDILNACVYRFYGLRSGSCSQNIRKSLKLISSKGFAKSYDRILDDILAKSAGPQLRILVLGYSPFFDEALTNECNDKSFGYWKIWRPKLTVRLRRQLNEIAQHLNQRIAGIVGDRRDERIVWVDWAPRFKDHLFCQPGKRRVSDGDNTWFFDVDFRTMNLTREDLEAGDDTEVCEQRSQDSEDWVDCAIDEDHAERQRVSQVRRRGWRDEFSIARYPRQPGLARVFHPKPQGYAAIADAIRSHWPSIYSGSGISDKSGGVEMT
ncbi:hypothetical protein AJ79_04497 [Helicocarpus griseus UAMH5409]|uniref:SGNH hydrolase-type esterase domain-containing protein n=1 Tax=Helicocarpus griseus UAMH5409 TaxID=1447875 RepID=A0A2B7XU24_9EURO|nr:hypothetical protein AJ79_04497 [Helicocarpus griseus UAMH5409]